jgi:hypothetical protein
MPMPCPCRSPAMPCRVNSHTPCRVVAGKSRTRAGRPHAVSGRPMLIHTCHAMPMPRPCRALSWPWEVAVRTAWSWHGTGAAWRVNQTRPDCVNQMGNTQSSINVSVGIQSNTTCHSFSNGVSYTLGDMFRPYHNGHLQAYILGGVVNTIVIWHDTRSRILRITVVFTTPPSI